MTDSKFSAQLYEKLSKPFSEAVERQVSKGGRSLTYIPQAEVVNRLNQVFGVDNWSSTVIAMFIHDKWPDSVIAHVRLTATVVDDDGNVHTVSRDGVGGQPIKMRKDQTGPVDLGDEFKGAVSDALKKAAQMFGVGMYLARDEEAIEEDNAPVPHPAWDEFVNQSKALDTVAKDRLKAAWTERTKGARKMTATTVTDDDMTFLREQVVALSLGGEFVKP